MYSLQALAGEVARIQQECTYFLETLGELEQLSDHRMWLADEQEDAVEQATRNYSWSARENLERATGDLRNWWGAVRDAINQNTTHLGY
jgi:hypothetical protein